MKYGEGYQAFSVPIGCGNSAIGWKNVNMKGDWHWLPKAEFAGLSIP